MANLRTNNLSGEQGQNAYRGSLFFSRGTASAQSDSLEFSGIAIGTSDFTIEGWLYKTKTGNYPVIFDTRESGNADAGGFFFGTDSSNYLYFYTQSTNAIKQTIISNFSWYHFALVRTGGTTTLYLNGQVSGTYSDSNNYSNDITKLGTSQQYTGGVQNNWNWGGYLSNIRIVVGSAVYTSAFTPPTSELKAIPNTKLLCCQDTDNPLQEATGKTLTGFGRYEHLNDTELVTNGSGLTTTGWTDAYTSTFTVENGMIKATRSGGSGYTAYQTITTVTGQQYTVSVNIEYGSGNYSDLRVLDGGTPSGSSTMLAFLRSTSASTDGKKSTTITALSTSTTLVFTFDDGGDTGKFSQISVKAADQGILQKFTPPFGVDAGNTFGGPIQQSSQGYMYFPTGRTEERGRGRGIVAGGSPGTDNNEQIEFFDIQSDGVVTEFGELASARRGCAGCSSSTRGLIGGGTATNPSPSFTNSMEFITIATTSNALDFGDLNNATRNIGGLSNSTRGLFAGGGDNPTFIDVIDFFTIASTGNATDFGNLVTFKKGVCGVSSPTRGLFAGGIVPGVIRVIDLVEIATAGNATDFGDLTNDVFFCGGVSSPTRGVYGGGSEPSQTNIIQFVTIASAGDATDFGDLLDQRNPDNSQICSHTRGLFVGGENPGPSACKLVDKITIATTGDATNFGDIRTSTSQSAGCSDSHGGLS